MAATIASRYRRLVAACDRLAVIIAETARHTGRKASIVQCAKKPIEFYSKPRIHASDHVFSNRLSDVFCSLRILPGEVLIYELDNGSRDSPGLTLLLDSHAYLFRHLDTIDLRRALVNRPEVLVNAGFCLEAFIGRCERTRLCIWLGNRGFISERSRVVRKH